MTDTLAAALKVWIGLRPVQSEFVFTNFGEEKFCREFYGQHVVNRHTSSESSVRKQGSGLSAITRSGIFRIDSLPGRSTCERPASNLTPHVPDGDCEVPPRPGSTSSPRSFEFRPAREKETGSVHGGLGPAWFWKMCPRCVQNEKRASDFPEALDFLWRPQPGLNRCYRRERPTS